jgi:hypothetical protein
MCVALTSAAAALSAVGCGTADPPSTANFTARAVAICKQVNDGIGGNIPKIENQKTVALAASKNAVLELEGLAALTRLEPPATLQRDWVRLLVDRRNLERQLTALAKAETKHDTRQARALVKSKERIYAELLPIARRDGIGECGR